MIIIIMNQKYHSVRGYILSYVKYFANLHYICKKMLTNEILTLRTPLLCVMKSIICLLHGWCVAVKKTDVTAVHNNMEISLHQHYCLANNRANIFTYHIKYTENHLKSLHTTQFVYRLYYYK
jgi:hypothetical protein